MSNYWQDRQKELYSALEKDENDLKIRLASVYEDEYSRLDKEIAAYYQKYGENSVIKYRNLMQTLPKEDVKLLIEQMDDFAAKYPQYAHLLPVRTSIYKLDRLEGLQYSVRMHQLNISAVNQQAISEHLNKQALRGANAAMETMGFGKNFYTVNSDIVKKFVDVPWCNGLSFSQRIWQDGDKLANYITTDIAQGFARGTSYQKLTKQLCTRFEGVAKKDAYRLIYTEGTYVMAESTIQPFTEDFEDYRVSTAADGKVCSICSSIAKGTFKIKDRKPGINFPPFHPWCRCTFEIVEPADWDKWMDDYVKRHKSSGEKVLNNLFDNGIMNSGSEKTLDMVIDKFTPCLENAETGEILETVYSIATKTELKNLKGWNFNWLDDTLKNSMIYKLQLKNSPEIQGLVALTKFERDKAIYVNIAESAPHNLGKNKKYNGVGGHLFAIAAQKSVDLGYGGFVFMDAKNVELVKHYKNALGAQFLGIPHQYRMFIDEDAAERLLKIYTLNKEGL